MAFPQIPAEVVQQIVKHQSANADLCSAALTCRALREEAQRILFHTPVPRTAYRHLIFMDAILSSPDRLGPMVRNFVHVSGSAYYDGENEVLVEKTGSMLRAMCNLKRLAFRNAKKLPAGVLHGTTFQLDAFDWGSAQDNTIILGIFLPTQPGLKHLTFHGKEAPVTPEIVQLCPQLRSVTGGRAAVKLFVTGKRITHLQWMPNDSNEALFPAPGLRSELERLHFLRCRGTRENFPRFANQLRSLVLLEITGNGPIVDSDFKELQIGLEQIPTLQVLILVDYVVLNRVSANPLYLSSITSDIFSWCPYLEHIDIDIGFSAVYHGQHEQFRRFHRAGVLEGVNLAGIVVEEAMVYAWRSLSDFGGPANRIQPVARHVQAT